MCHVMCSAKLRSVTLGSDEINLTCDIVSPTPLSFIFHIRGCPLHFNFIKADDCHISFSYSSVLNDDKKQNGIKGFLSCRYAEVA